MGKENTAAQYNALHLFAASFLSLFLEVALIRWVPASLRIIAYYTNLVLISCFLGLGIGFSLKDRKDTLAYFVPLLAALLLLLPVLKWMVAFAPPFVKKGFAAAVVLSGCMFFIYVFATIKEKTRFQRTLFYCFLACSFLLLAVLPVLIKFYKIGTEGMQFDYFIFGVQGGVFSFLLSPLVFVMCCLVFIPLGQYIARLFSQFPPLTAYSINILGSLLGVVCMGLVSYLTLSPLVWFLLCFGLTLFLLVQEKKFSIFPLVCLAACTAVIFLSLKGEIWSPYYKINLVWTDPDKKEEGFQLVVNHDYHQRAANLSDAYVSKVPGLKALQDVYDLPYLFNRPKDVLIVGAGNGNDVAAALRAGVGAVDAVEIDPVIRGFGNLHPEKPYADGRVNTIISDARGYIRNTNKKYDVIAYGFLDSQTLFSSMSNLRLDNFVYTMEGIKEARAHLKPDGVLALSFSVRFDWIGKRLYRLLTEAFGKEPLVFSSRTGNISLQQVFISSNHIHPDFLKKVNLSSVRRAEEYRNYDVIPASTDNWPYLYLKNKSLTNNYLSVLFALLFLSVLFIAFLMPDVRKISPHFFFLGFSFMLLETRAITALSLLFGSTWIVNTVVISGILLMILAANMLVLKMQSVPSGAAYGGLFLTLLLTVLLPQDMFLKLPFLLRLALSGCFITLPLFFAGIIFASSFKDEADIPSALSSNLLGAVLGGLAEYLSLVTGFKFLYFLIIAGYFLSARVRIRGLRA